MMPEKTIRLLYVGKSLLGGPSNSIIEDHHHPHSPTLHTPYRKTPYKHPLCQLLAG
jgi:ABC-type antimicrobial peptide transport system ATPase subunit